MVQGWNAGVWLIEFSAACFASQEWKEYAYPSNVSALYNVYKKNTLAIRSHVASDVADVAMQQQRCSKKTCDCMLSVRVFSYRADTSHGVPPSYPVLRCCMHPLFKYTYVRACCCMLFVRMCCSHAFECGNWGEGVGETLLTSRQRLSWVRNAFRASAAAREIEQE